MDMMFYKAIFLININYTCLNILVHDDMYDYIINRGNHIMFRLVYDF